MKKWLYVSIAVVGISLFLFMIVASIFSGIIGAKSASDQQTNYAGCSVVETGKLTEQSLNQFLKKRGVFHGTASFFLKYGEQYNVDPALAVAIAMHETGNGSSRMVREMNNPGGLMGDSNGFQFSTLEKGIEAMIRNLSENYTSQGLTTPETIQPKYAPIGAANDGTGLNKAWLNGVNGFLKQLGGQSSCSKETVVGTGTYIVPVKNPHISSGYVDRINPVTGAPEHHKGLDFAQPIGDDIFAAADGKVVVAMQPAKSGSGFGGYGFVTVIEHAKSREWTLYGHQSQIFVQVGQEVKQGQVIGKVGSTGQSTGPHLHFEVRKEMMGGQLDPAKVLGLQTNS
ncbi:peptidoglycan DD-metalloendopeptidase family protein [Listeria goaensis]|uniref:peptidoglycan DD-metalloendopeptidase family protein n=1 Tax=Listeria goaensis TaxID=1649188 RepID=UPI001FC9AE1F|nr:peptidoglycan DD-metalloendopeptidase family protein [Listeria goaensis]